MDRKEEDRNSFETDVFQIFEDIFSEEDESVHSGQEKADVRPVPVEGDPFYEIEYDSGPFPGVGKYVLRSGKIPESQKDEIRKHFDRMRDIARENRSLYFNSSKFYDRRVQQENARIFYKQGMFMEDYEDDYEKVIPYSAYYPSYQNMGYEQLRTYFTWRTKVRRGEIEGTSLSYAFLYIYELLNTIGAGSPEEGLDRLMCFWDTYRVYDRTLDKYVPGWLKDYHIYYGMDESFREFAERNNLMEYYPELADPDDYFERLCAISKYDIRKSVFYTDGNEQLLREGFAYVMQNLEQIFEAGHLRLEDHIYQPVKNMPVWIPFKGALFYPHILQDDRKVIFSQKEIYVCSHDSWTFSTMLTAESGKKLIGYVMKQTEAVLRKAAKYRHKLTANSNTLSPATLEELTRAGICLEEAVTRAALEYYKKINKTVVRIDSDSLDRIRREALATQEKLIVPEEDGEGITSVFAAGRNETKERPFPSSICRVDAGDHKTAVFEKAASEGMECEKSRSSDSTEFERKVLPGNTLSEKKEFFDGMELQKESSPGNEEFSAGESFVREGAAFDSEEENSILWDMLGSVLNDTEFKAIVFALYQQTEWLPFSADREEFAQWKDIKQFAEAHGIMQEVLADGINEKAADRTGDSLLDDEFAIYEDYVEQTREMVEKAWQRRYLQG